MAHRDLHSQTRPGGGTRRSSQLHRRITVSGQAGLMRRRPARVPAPRSAFAGYRFPPAVIMIAVRWYLRYGLSYRDVEELLAERGIEVDHVTIYRWVQRFTPLLIDAARPCRHSPGIGGSSMRQTSKSPAGGFTLPSNRPVRPGHRRPR